MRRILIALFVLTFVLSTSEIAMATQTKVYSDVPVSHWSYDALKQLAQVGVIKSEYTNRYNNGNLATRIELAGIVVNAMTKYDKANAQSKAVIDKLRVEFDEEIAALGIVNQLTNKNNKKTKFEPRDTPRFIGEFKQYYNYTNTYGKRTSTELYSDIRFGFTGTINEDWSYIIKYLTVGNATNKSTNKAYSSPNMSYRNTYSPGTQLYLAQLSNKNFYGGQLYLGKYWSGFTTQMENKIYVDAIRGIGYTKTFDKLTLGVDYGMLDWIPSEIKKPSVRRFTASTRFGDTLVGGAIWNLSNYDNFSKLREFQIRKPITKDLQLSYIYGNSDAAKESTFSYVQLKYKEANLSKVGSNSIIINYHTYGKNALLDIGELNKDTSNNGLKGWGIEYSFVPYKAVIWRNTINPDNKSITGNTKSTAFRSRMDFIL